MIQIVSSGGAVTNAETEIASVAAGAQRAWYVVETKRHRERQAQNHLAERHVPSYLPRIVQWPRPAVGSAIAPMFPGYLFVHAAFPDDFYRTVWTPGVKTFVSFGGFTSPLDACVVDFLRSQEGPDGIIHCGDRFKESSEVRIIRGPFQRPHRSGHGTLAGARACAGPHGPAAAPDAGRAAGALGGADLTLI